MMSGCLTDEDQVVLKICERFKQIEHFGYFWGRSPRTWFNSNNNNDDQQDNVHNTSNSN